MNTYTFRNQYAADVVTLLGGEFLVVWHTSDPERENGITVRGQRYDAAGLQSGTEQLISAGAVGREKEDVKPAIDAAPDGGFVVVWEAYYADESDIFGQRFAPDGVALGEQFVANSYTTFAQESPSLAVTPSGAFVVCWTDHGSLEEDVYRLIAQGQRFNATGEKVGDAFNVSTIDGFTNYPTVAAIGENTFVVVWEHQDNRDGGGLGVFGQRFGADGSRDGSEFQVNTYTSANQRRPDVAALPDGGFVVAWQSYTQDGSGYAIVARRFHDSALASAPEFLVNSYTTYQQTLPSIDADETGGFVIIWESYDAISGGPQGQDGDGRGVFGQRFAADGSRDGSEFQVNTYTTGNQGRLRAQEIDVAAHPDGRFVAVWQSPDQDGDRGGIFGQRFRIDESPSAVCGNAHAVDDSITASDALVTLQAATLQAICELCRCDVDGSGTITATDALIVLRAATGQSPVLSCPPCPDES